jgi:hypothetical protein
MKHRTGLRSQLEGAGTSMSETTQLAFCQLTPTDELAVQLLQPRMPPVERTLHRTVVRIMWPVQPTLVDAREFPDTAAVVVKLFAGAATEPSRIRATCRDLL